MGGPEELLGSLVAGRYRLDKVLGEGGFGAVYVATRQDGSRVALKVLAEKALERVGGDDRFRREAELARRLDHPNVVKVLDEGIDDRGTRYIAFELLDGRPLDDEIGRWGAIQPRRAIHIVMGVLDALDVAHSMGIIHRDLKPANIMLLDGSKAPGAGGGVSLKVLDFGIAKSINKNTIAGLTQAGQVLGTPAYMAVEQLTGDPVTPATDIFALGVVLIEMILGKPPYPPTSTAMDIVRSRLTGLELELPADLAQHPLGAIALRATKPHPMERYQSVAEMRAALQQAMASPALHQTLQSPHGGSGVGPTVPPTGVGYHPTAAHTSAPVVVQAGFTEPGPPPAALTPVKQPGTSAGAIAGVAIVVGAILVGGIGIGLWVSAEPDETELASAGDEDDDESAEDDDGEERRKKKKRKKKRKSAAPEPTRTEGLPPPDPPPPVAPPPPPPTPTTFATRVMTCRGAAVTTKASLSSHVTVIGWTVSGTLRYCAGNMVNFRCQGGGGDGVTAKNGAMEGRAVVVRFGSRSAATTFADSQRGKSAAEPATYATDGASVLYIQMPDAEADKLMARICK